MYILRVERRDGGTVELCYPIVAGLTLIRDVLAALSRGDSVHIDPAPTVMIQVDR